MKRKDQTFGFKLLSFISGDKTNIIAIPLISILLGLIVSSLILVGLGVNPAQTFASFVQGCGFLAKPSYAAGKGMITDILSFLGILAPMLIAALAFVVGMRASLFNIGISGQMLAAGFTAYVFVGYSELGSVIAKPLVILVGLVVGGLLGAFIGLLKSKFNIHEVVSTIIINYIINYVVTFFINSYYADTITRSMRKCSAASRLTVTGIDLNGFDATFPIGIIVALILVVIMKVFLDRTAIGFELRSVGQNKDCAEYAGINVNKSIMISMAISGALAGIAGVTFYLGYYNTIVPNTLSDVGYDCITVATVGSFTPVGCIIGAILITILQAGSTYMSSTIGIAKEVASVITGIILLFSACGGYITFYATTKKRKILDEIEAAKKAEAKASVEQPAKAAEDADSKTEGEEDTSC